jgi:hypothetical protein
MLLVKQLQEQHLGKKENTSRESEVTCYYCQKKGHVQSECRSKKRDEAKNAGESSGIKCFLCGKADIKNTSVRRTEATAHSQCALLPLT